jgi:hypothetical protein
MLQLNEAQLLAQVHRLSRWACRKEVLIKPHNSSNYGRE